MLYRYYTHTFLPSLFHNEHFPLWKNYVCAMELWQEPCVFSAGISCSPSFSSFAGYEHTVQTVSSKEMDMQLGNCHIWIWNEFGQSIIREKGETEQSGTYVVWGESQKRESSSVQVNSTCFLHGPFLFLRATMKIKKILAMDSYKPGPEFQ